jgi:hypothetical protein
MSLEGLGSVSMSEQKIQESAMVAASPFNFHPLFAAEFVGVEKLAMLHSMLVNKFGNLHVKATIFCNLHDPLFAPPFDRVDSVRCLTDAKCRLGNVIQFQPVPRHLFDLEEEVQRSQLMRQVKDRVPHQDFVVEADDVKSDHQIGAYQLLNQIVHPVLWKDPILAEDRAVSDSKRHAHIALLVPSAHIICRALSFEVEVDNVHEH